MTPLITPQSALLLDIDGTILDFASTPNAVIVPDALRHSLSAIANYLGGAFAFVSGRPLSDIDSLFGPSRSAAIGVHGGEIRFADGRTHRSQPLPRFVRDLFLLLNDRFPGLSVEDKGCAVALHYRRNLAALPAIELSMREHASRFNSNNIAILQGKMVLEARHAGIDKGTAVQSLAKTPPFAGRDIVFGGDDTTDTDVFRILPLLGGYGFSVGCAYDGVGHVFESPAAVRDWLSALAQGLRT